MSTNFVFRRALPRPDFPLFDVHTHVGTAESEARSYGRLSPSEALAWMDEAGVCHACAFSPLRSNYAAANQALSAWSFETQGRVLPFARLGGTGGPRPIRQRWQARAALRASVVGVLRRARGSSHSSASPWPGAPSLDGVVGVKLLPHMDGLPDDETFAAIAQRGLPVLIHAGIDSPPAWIAERVLPRTTGPVILAHLGCFPDDEPLLRDAVALARAEPRVWLDTSAVWRPSFIRFAADRVPDRLLFGSDAPLMHPTTAWAHVVSALPSDDARLRAIGWGNAARLFGVDPAPPQH